MGWGNKFNFNFVFYLKNKRCEYLIEYLIVAYFEYSLNFEDSLKVYKESL